MEQVPEQTTLTVVKTVSDALGTPHDELPPLSNAIDIDALEVITADDSLSAVRVAFTYAGLRVTVYSRDVVYVRPTASESDRLVDTAPRYE